PPRHALARQPPSHSGRPVSRRSTTSLGRPGARLGGGLAAMLLILAVLGGRLVWLQGINSAAYAETASRQRLSTTTLLAPRGQITDRNGVPLALTVDARAVFGEPRTIAKATCPPVSSRPCTAAAIAAALAPVLHVPADVLTAKLSRTSAFVYLARQLDPAVAKQVRSLDLIGIGTLPEPKRIHPAGDVAANVVGFMDRDGMQGLAGVEYGWGSVLAGRDGRATAETDRAGRVIPNGVQSRVPPVPGRDIELTLDRDLQWYAQQTLTAKVAETKALNGAVIVLDVRTGEVLAMASTPTFNPDATSPVTDAARRNTAIGDTYEPGSVNKVITAAAALEAGIVTPSTVITVPNTYQVAGHTLHDAEQHPLEHLTFAGVIAKSSNIGTVQVAQQLGPDRLYAALRNFGFGTLSGLGLPGEQRGFVPKPASWSGTSIATIPIGQGLSVNALQVASVYAAVANDGVRVTPNIIKALADGTGRMVAVAPATARRVVPSSVATTLRSILEAVITDQGTAPLAAVPGYRIAGKTGTAQRPDGHGGYGGGYTASFVGMAPADAPRLVCAVVIQAPQHPYFGGLVAAPVFHDVMGFALRSFAIPPTGTTAAPLRLTAG
ncbi:MAG: penicillin-binding protein 2, partial [Actinomycetota bacterium]|nr:penicillin-binding protein 2 [Actinomycetota bacterium]